MVHDYLISRLVCLTDSLRYGQGHLSNTAMRAVLDDIEDAVKQIRDYMTLNTPPTAS